MSLDTIKCPNCGYMYQMDLGEYKQNLETIVTRGIFGKDKSKLESSNLIDLKCPNSACGKSFEWKVE